MNWQTPPDELRLGDSEVHIWLTNLDAISPSFEMLSIGERSRADRFKFEQHRQRFIAGRGFLRSLLGCYLNTDPATLEFDYGAHGKPFLKHSTLQFNLAHSQHLALHAVTYDRAVGIDIEQIRVIDQVERLAQRFFLPSEAEAVQTQPDLFFQYWTCKEAFLKATGIGLSGLKEIEIDRFQLRSIPPEARSQQWQLHPITISDQFAGAIVIEQNCSQLDLRYFHIEASSTDLHALRIQDYRE
ncbi:4'-phosphopantetheinyl transferase superfamily protein [Cyanobacteria bacterium FACHB-DQ100]|nr:4'-phosphopantetheinyl transferase superfamily protein [Cyanobacteria bacterium FACHB-DQ100]